MLMEQEKAEHTVRRIPFDLDAAIKLDPSVDPIWINGDKGASYLTIGYSFALEFSEYIVSFSVRALQPHVDDPDLRHRVSSFNRQEANHAWYHRIWNEQLVTRAPTREKYHPRVPEFFYGSYKVYREPLLGRLLEPQGEADVLPVLKDLVLRLSIFETLTCATGLAFFETFFDNGEFERTVAATRNLAVLYLFGYHMAEEIEHCAASLDAYEHIFKEPVWSESVVQRTVDGSLHPTELDVYHAAFAVARLKGETLDLGDLKGNSFARRQRQTQLETFKPGFHPNDRDVLAKRSDYVDRWDRQWEPALRDRIEKRLST